MLLALLLLVVACDGDGNGNENAVVSPLPGSPGEELTAEEELLAAAALTVEDVAEVFPGSEWRTTKSSQQLISKGQRAAWVAVQESQGAEVITTELRMYETADGASDAMQDSLERAGRKGEFSEDVSTTVFLRVDTVVASVNLAGSEGEKRGKVKQLARTLAEKIEAPIQG